MVSEARKAAILMRALGSVVEELPTEDLLSFTMVLESAARKQDQQWVIAACQAISNITNVVKQ